MRKNCFNYLVVVGCLILLSGCVQTFQYDHKTGKMTEAPSNSVVIVKNFADERAVVMNNTNDVWVGGIPLLPFGWGDFAQPENGSYFLGLSSYDFEPGIDFAKAAEKSLKESGLFKKVFYADTFTDYQNARYVFTGLIYSTNYSEKIITYGISVFSPALWVLGLPDGVTGNELKIRFLLKDSKTGKIVWSYLFDEKTTAAQWFYLWNRNFDGYSEMMFKAMSDAIKNLYQYMDNNKSSFSSIEHSGMHRVVSTNKNNLIWHG